jgi:L-cysteate sulfo-lyase
MDKNTKVLFSGESSRSAVGSRWDDACAEVVADWSGPGYGLTDTMTEEAIRLAGRYEGLVIDPVYSGKAMAGLIGLARQGRFRDTEPVVWIHTGGAPGLFAYPTTMARLSK